MADIDRYVAAILRESGHDRTILHRVLSVDCDWAVAVVISNDCRVIDRPIDIQLIGPWAVAAFVTSSRTAFVTCPERFTSQLRLRPKDGSDS